MQASLKKYLIIVCPPVCFLLLMVVAVSSRHSPQQELTELQIDVAQIRLGATVEEAEALFGASADATTETKGVIVDSKTMFTAANEQAAKYVPPEDYVLHTWKRGEFYATVAFDEEGQAVCRWAWWNNPPPRTPYSPYQVLKRVGL
ncbi:hypothetical protein Pan153_13850 [Gimesia panareensis]|uniref:Uncharacterized protein n=1 Tax=Gimesia panareensis TaxID=2527978 RepID=A0A518FKC4_9PLAN|nr:hypothetical protein [Gimesia panareensis]QDV16753.1 hypothetical protein Pan153_13850 [Gimesia panareensis]